MSEGKERRRERTFRRKVFAGEFDFDRRLVSSGVLRATSQESSYDEIVDPFVVSGEVVRVRGRMNWRMRFIVLLSIPWSFKTVRV